MENKLIQYGIKEIFPESKIINIHRFDTGLSSSKIFLVLLSDPDKKLIFKIFPEDYRSRIKKEISILKELESTEIPSPKIIYFNIDKMFLIEEYIEGELLFKAITKREFNKEIMVSVGKNIAKIHNLPIKEIWQDKNKIINEEEWVNSVKKRNVSNLNEIKKYNFLSENEFKFLKRYLEDFSKKLKNEIIFLCPIHGDYNPQNIIINNSEVNGIFDFEVHKVGHNINDLGIVYYWYKFYEKEKLFPIILKGYNEIINLTDEEISLIYPYYIMQVIGALSFLIKNGLDKKAVLRLKKLLNEFLNLGNS